jgi:acyl-CoA thioester hydrolase
VILDSVAVKCMNPVFYYSHTVTPDEIDRQVHVHNLRYLQWSLWAAQEHTDHSGWDSEGEFRRGIGWVVRSHEITYRAAAMAGDRILVQTWVSEADAFSARRRYAITRPADRQLLARVETRWVLVNFENHKLIRLDDKTLATLQVLPEPPPLPWEEGGIGDVAPQG